MQQDFRGFFDPFFLCHILSSKCLKSSAFQHLERTFPFTQKLCLLETAEEEKLSVWYANPSLPNMNNSFIVVPHLLKTSQSQSSIKLTLFFILCGHFQWVMNRLSFIKLSDLEHLFWYYLSFLSFLICKLKQSKKKLCSNVKIPQISFSVQTHPNQFQLDKANSTFCFKNWIVFLQKGC